MLFLQNFNNNGFCLAHLPPWTIWLFLFTACLPETITILNFETIIFLFIDVTKRAYAHICSLQLIRLQLHVLNLQSIHFSLKYFFHTVKTCQYFELMMPNWRLYLATVYTIGTGCSRCNRHCVNHLDCDSGGCGFWSSECKCYNCRRKNQVYNLWIQLYRFYTYRIPRGIIAL